MFVTANYWCPHNSETPLVPTQPIDTVPSQRHRITSLMKPTTVLAAGAGAGAAVLAIRQLERWCDRDECWLALADRIRRQLPPPPQSSFRVVAVVALGSRLRGEYVVGTNIEAGNLHNSVCAERVAFGALQLYGVRRPGAVRCIYIVTDAPQPISPGALCREFMYSSPFCEPSKTQRTHEPPRRRRDDPSHHPGTRVLSATPDLGQRLDVTLAELLPRASPYCRLGAADQRKWAKATSLQTPPSGSAAATAYAAAQRASRDDDRDDLHPTRYGVACAFDAVWKSTSELGSQWGQHRAEWGARNLIST